jgi:hypothetical protein
MEAILGKSGAKGEGETEGSGTGAQLQIAGLGRTDGTQEERGEIREQTESGRKSEVRDAAGETGSFRGLPAGRRIV